MSKERKAAVLEHWFGIDKVLFGRNSKDALSEGDYTRYCTTKGALLSNLHEIYKKVDYSPETKTYDNMVQMAEASIIGAKHAIAEASEILKSSNVSKILMDEITEAGHYEGLSEQEVARYVVTKRRNAVALDSLTMGKALNDNKDVLSDWQGKVLVDAHKTLRDAIIDISLI